MDFIVLPDHPTAATVAAKAAGDHARILHHPSGQPWIVGQWGDGEVVTATDGNRSVVLLGRTTVTRAILSNWLRTIRSADDIGRRSLDLPGCFHLVGSFDGVTWTQGSLAGAYRFFHAMVDGLVVAASAPDRLIALTHAALDEKSLPLCLLGPYARPPWPISERTLWRGVHKLPPGHRLLLDTSGRSRTVRWWFAPEPTVSLADSADLLRERLLEAVASRVDHTGATGLSCDLSGGMDSTSLCFAAEHQGIPLTTLHVTSSDPSSRDRWWAKRCQEDLRLANHLMVEPDLMPGYYAEPKHPAGSRWEGPTSMLHEAMIEMQVRILAEAGSGRHMRGDGSDEIFHRTLTSTAALIRRRPIRRLHGLLRMKARQRWNLRTTVRNILPPTSYHRWLRRVASDLTAAPDWNQRPEWDIALKLPRWASREAVSTVRELYLEAVERREQPMISDPGQNEVFRYVQLTGESVRQLSHVGRQHGVTFEAPYVDDRVLQAALAVRLEDRARVGVNKPVLAAAMRGVVPQDVLDRRDKSNGNRDMFASLRRNRHRLEDLCRNSELARRGLVDADVLRESVLGLHVDLTQVVPLGATWAAERWLRALPRAHQADGEAVVPQYA